MATALISRLSAALWLPARSCSLASDAAADDKQEYVVDDSKLPLLTLKRCYPSDVTMQVHLIGPIPAPPDSNGDLFKITHGIRHSPRFRRRSHPPSYLCLKIFNKDLDVSQIANEVKVSLLLSKAMATTDPEPLQSSVPIVRALHAHRIETGTTRSFALSMDLCEGGTLLRFLSDLKSGAGRFVSESEATRFFLPLAKALRFVHKNRVIHCDVRPENVLLERYGCLETARLTGFSMAVKVPTRNHDMFVVRHRQQRGNDPFVAPETACSAIYSPLSDVYGLGTLLLDALTGIKISGSWRSPRGSYWPRVDGSFIEFQIKSRDRRGGVGVWPSLSEAARDLIKGMLCPDPIRRLNFDGVLAHPWLSAPRTAMPPPPPLASSS